MGAANKQEVSKEEIYLKDFLGTFSLSSAEILRYEKIYKKTDQLKSREEWSKITGLTQSTKDKK